MTPVILCVNVERSYPMGSKQVAALRGVSFEVDAGEFVAITGPSGCGKSTLLHLLGVVDTPTAGTIVVNGVETSTMDDRAATQFRLRQIGFVFQRFYLVPTLSARENIELPMAEAGMPKRDRRERVRELLSYVALEDRADHRPAQLSGGEQQRIAIARALANRPQLLLADEPTGELDAATGAALLALFQQLNADGTTLVFVTHDPVVAGTARRVIALRDGLVASDGKRTP